MKSPQRKATEVRTDIIAKKLAGYILNTQLKISGRLNERFNTYSPKVKKIIIVSLGFITTVALITSSFGSFYTMPRLKQNYNSAYIGQASDFPFSKLYKRQLTDSLTKKNQSWKEH